MKAQIVASHHKLRPDFYVVGAPKCGTTALFGQLAKHPEMDLPQVKEPAYHLYRRGRPTYTGPGDESSVNSRVVINQDEYEALFAHVRPDSVTGEATPYYFYSDEAASSIAAHSSDVRIVILLRDPVGRTHSHWMMMRRDRREPCADLLAAVRQEDARLESGWSPGYGYVRLSRYAAHLSRWLDMFGGSVMVRTYEEYRAQPVRVLEDVCRHLGVSPECAPGLGHDETVNLSGEPRSEWFADLLRSDHALKRPMRRLLPEDLRRRLGKQARHWNLRRPELDSLARSVLQTELVDDARNVEKLLGRSLRDDWPLTFA